MRRFIEEQRVACKPSTILGYLCHLRDFCAFLRTRCDGATVTSHCIASINRNTLDAYLAYLHHKPLKPYSRVSTFLVVRKYLAWEVDRGTIARSALAHFDRARLPKVPDYLPRPLSHETDRLLIDRLRQSCDPYARVFLLLRLTGLRISELINLAHDCVVTVACNERFLKVPLGKMNNERVVPLSAEAYDIVMKLKAARGIPCAHRDTRRLIGIKGPVPRVYRRLAIPFKKYTADIVDQNKPITFHRLRHTYATSLLSGGVSIVSIMKLLGHRRIEMSLRYAQITPTHLRNEYLKALATLESRYMPKNDAPAPRTMYLAPTDVIGQLAVFIKKESGLNAASQKILARRFARLAYDIHHINLPATFPLIPTQHS